jgi:hypothetical protein
MTPRLYKPGEDETNNTDDQRAAEDVSVGSEIAQ